MIRFLAMVSRCAEGYTVHIPDAYRDTVSAFIERRGDKVFEVAIGIPRRPRTTGWQSQNHHANGHIQQICAETGNTFSAVKERMKELAVPRGWPIETMPDRSCRPKSESESSVEEASALIDTIHQFAAEWGIALREDDDVGGGISQGA
jgi:hypothetical protein